MKKNDSKNPTSVDIKSENLDKELIANYITNFMIFQSNTIKVLSDLSELAKRFRTEIDSLKPVYPVKNYSIFQAEDCAEFWFVDHEGHVLISEGETIDSMLVHFNNCWPTEESCEKHKLRLESMRPTCPFVDGYHLVLMDSNYSYKIMKIFIDTEKVNHNILYNLGRIFHIDDIILAERWLDQYAQAWSTVDDRFGA